MFTRKSKEKTKLDEAIELVFAEMAGHESDSKEYAAMTKQLEKLYKLKEKHTSKKPVSRDTLVMAGASVLSVLIVVGYEQTHAMTSKALNFIAKPR